MYWRTDILEENGVAIAARAASGFDALISSAGPADDRAPGLLPDEPRAMTEGLDELDPRLAAFWLWEYGAASPTPGQDDARSALDAEGPMPFYVPLVAAHNDRSLVEGAEYIGAAELHQYLRGPIANDNWLLRRLK